MLHPSTITQIPTYQLHVCYVWAHTHQAKAHAPSYCNPTIVRLRKRKRCFPPPTHPHLFRRPPQVRLLAGRLVRVSSPLHLPWIPKYTLCPRFPNCIPRQESEAARTVADAALAAERAALSASWAERSEACAAATAAHAAAARLARQLEEGAAKRTALVAAAKVWVQPMCGVRCMSTPADMSHVLAQVHCDAAHVCMLHWWRSIS